MRIKLDENLPERLVPFLGALGHDVDTVVAEHIAGQDDPVVWAAAQAERRFLITQDLDFSDVRRFEPGTIMGSCSSDFQTLAAMHYSIESPRCSATKMSRAGMAAW